MSERPKEPFCPFLRGEAPLSRMELLLGMHPQLHLRVMLLFSQSIFISLSQAKTNP